MKSFNGFRSWNVWNVVLWMNNDETNYNLGRSIVEHVIHCWDKNRFGHVYSNQEKIDIATSRLLGYMNPNGKEKTPDGANFNRISLRTWIEGEFEGVEESDEYKECQRLGLV